MAVEDNAALLRRLVEAFSEGDMQTVGGSFAEDAVWHLPGNSVLSGDHRGRDAIVELIGRAVEISGGTFQLELIDIMASDAYGVLWQRITAQRDGESLDETEAIVCRIGDGKIVEIWHRPEQYALDEFYSSS